MSSSAPGPDPTIERLASAEGARLLASLPPYEEATALETLQRLRDSGVDADLASAALTQSRLRARALPRLGPTAERLLLTQDGLEQATRPPVAARHAERLAAAGIEHVLDLGCGLGLDALALAARGLRVTAVERDPEVAALARANLAAYPDAVVVRGDALDQHPAPGDGLWLDPARRTPGVADVTGRTRRLFRLDELSPSWEEVRRLAGGVRAAGCKLSPGLRPADVPTGCSAEWVGLDGSALECVVWWGAAAAGPGRVAAVGRSTGLSQEGWPTADWVEVSEPEDDPGILPGVDELGPWLGEPDRTVLAADLASALAHTTGGQELDHGVGYVSADAPVDLPWARWYAVEEVLPLRAKQVRGWLRERGHDRVTLKKRGVPTDPEAFRRELRLPRRASGTEATLVLTRVAGRPCAVAVSAPDAGSAAR